MIIEEHAQRMFNEYTELADRVARLNMFLDSAESSGLQAEELRLMNDQLNAMAAYAEALGRRLTNYFNNLDYTL